MSATSNKCRNRFLQLSKLQRKEHNQSFFSVQNSSNRKTVEGNFDEKIWFVVTENYENECQIE